MEFVLYILECVDGSFYIGHTDNLDKRMEQHDDGKGCAYTAVRRPLQADPCRSVRNAYRSPGDGAKAQRLEPRE